MAKKPTIGIALDSGGAMGGAHIGVLDVLREHEIPVDIVVGSSAGALVGALYACNAMDEFKAQISGISFLEALSLYADPVFPLSGLLAGKKAKKFLLSLFRDTRIEDLPITFRAVATDILSGETVPLAEGPLVDAVMASISMPGIFNPVVIGERVLTDGGVSDPLPLDILEALSPDITIACNLHSSLPDKLSSSQSRSIVQAQKRDSENEEDLSSWFFDRMLSILPDDRADQVKSLQAMLMDAAESPVGALRENEFVRAVREQLRTGTEKIGSLFTRLLPKEEKDDGLNIFEILLNATNIQQYQKNRLMLRYMKPDILIEPVIHQVRALEFNKGEGTIAVGRKEALKAIPEIRRLMEEKAVQ